ncbi:lysis system i-spanin subunit Rz [Oxalobacter formigenes]|uniref:lysis system i-spanin subunit Rz n=1 Tax=Oxalobacter formigenes TaxID=847 RepID=UPI0022AE800C|nr:lysis system i-spanin subunit Rz [Oxalobacter formigenes]WAW01149.1 lysis system i-spanin subunit Rz [Oxalobacter formigenes]WAW03477.1 lysis system i-spanin subunit Rz [Oxalobacter formigenes]
MSLKSCLITGTLALIAGCLAGYWLCHLQWEASESQMNESQARQETERLEKAMEENRNLHQTVSQMQIQAKKENDDAKQKYDDLLARINRGTVRVSVPARSCSDVSEAGHSGTDDRETRAELDPATAESILAVGRDGDEAIRELNMCIDQYNAVKSSIAAFDKPKN